MDLHEIDKKLAVLEALTIKHMAKTDKDLQELKQAVIGMQIRVYGIAMTISILIGGVTLWLR